MERIAYETMKQEFFRVLIKNGFSEQRAELCARLFAETSRDGIYSHGLNRFPQFIDYIKLGKIKVNAEPEKIGEFGVVERWDGGLGPGNLNAYFSMNRAIELSRQSGMGCVALSNTNHWLRAGTYGWLAAEQGCIGLCWTNTMPNMPAWGASESKLGNNPFVLAVPREGGPIVLDIAMSQFSYGQLRNYANRNESLPVVGGFDRQGIETRDASLILESRRVMPIGYWKGSGLSLLLDLAAMMLSGGRSSLEVGKFQADHGVSQIFIVFDVSQYPDRHIMRTKIEEVIADLHQAAPSIPGEQVRYPGEGTLRVRQENLELGVPVDAAIWQQVLNL